MLTRFLFSVSVKPFRATSKKYLLIIAIGILPLHQAVAQQIISRVDRQSIGLDDTFWLTVATDLHKVDKTPDFSRLKKQFDILSTQQKRHYQIVNGRASSTREWRLLLAPKEAGKLVIPSFQLAGLHSETIFIHVSPKLQTPSATIANDIFLESFTDKKEVYVQQQVLFTLRLLTRVSLIDTQQADFTINSAVIEPLSEKQYKRRADNQNYTVLEKVYAIFPQTSGTVNIPSIKWQVEKGSRPFHFPLNPFDKLRKSNHSIVRLNSQPHTVSVLPVPDNYGSKHWLPTTQLIIEEEWDRDISKATVGEPISRTINIRGEGVNGAQIPPLDLPENKNFKIYPNLPKIENEKNHLGLIGLRTESYSIVPIQAGSFRLPEIALHWWDTENNEERISILPETALLVSGTAPRANSQNFTADPSNAIDNENLTTVLPESSSALSKILTKPLSSTIWQISALVFAFIALCFFILWRRVSCHRKHQKSRATEKENTLLISEKRAFQQLSSALSTENLPLIRQQLITWAQIHFNNASITCLSDITNHLPDEANNAIKALDQQLYGKNQYADWQSQDLLELIQQQRRLRGSPANTPRLKPLYP